MKCYQSGSNLHNLDSSLVQQKARNHCQFELCRSCLVLIIFISVKTSTLTFVSITLIMFYLKCILNITCTYCTLHNFNINFLKFILNITCTYLHTVHIGFGKMSITVEIRQVFLIANWVFPTGQLKKYCIFENLFNNMF